MQVGGDTNITILNESVEESPKLVNIVNRRHNIQISQDVTELHLNFNILDQQYSYILVLHLIPTNEVTLTTNAPLECWANAEMLETLSANKTYLLSIMSAGYSPSDLIISYIELNKPE
jgi:hypothetical protein